MPSRTALPGVVTEHELAAARDRRVKTGISCEEQAVTEGGPAVQEAPLITVWTDDPVMTAAEARALAALLQLQADRLDPVSRPAAQPELGGEARWHHLP